MPLMTLMLIDIGNTRLKWGMYQDATFGAKPIAQGAVFLERINELAERDWKQLPEPKHILVSSVTSQAVRNLVNEQLELWPVIPEWATVKASQCGVTNGYTHPVRLGIDRWMALIGAHQHLQTKSEQVPVIVSMVGTAVTVDALDNKGAFLGGIIMPGHGIMQNALRTGTAGLHVPTGHIRNFPTNTSDALTTGGTYAITGAIERMSINLYNKTGQKPKIVLTGGAAWKVISHLLSPAILMESLIFDGVMAVAIETWYTNPV